MAGWGRRRGRWARGGLAALVALAALAAAALVAAEWRTSSLVDPDALERGLARHQARAEAILERAGPDLQAQVLGALPPSRWNGACVRLDDHLADARASWLPGAQTPGSATDARTDSVWDLEFEGRDPVRLRWSAGGEAPEPVHGMLTVVAGDDYLVTAEPLDVPKDDVGEIRIRARAARGTRLELGWHGDQAPRNPWRHRVSVDLAPDGEFHTYVVNARLALQRGLRDGEHIRRLLIRPSNVDGDRVEIDFVRLVSQLAAYRDAAEGRTYFSLAGEMREGLYLLPGRSLRWRLAVPADRPRLDLGLAALRAAGAPRSTVWLAADGERTRLLEDEAPADRWLDRRIDLRPWAGREVELTLEVAPAPGNVVFWSSPVVWAPPRERRNVIVYVEDTLRADHLSLYGYGRETTPGKQRLAARAAVFENAVPQATRTRPSVPSLLTSLFPTTTGVWDFSEMLDEHYVTLAEMLRAQGFATASFIQNGNAGPVAGLHQGFSWLFDDATTGGKPDQILDGVVRPWLDAHADRNVFLYVHLIDPHGPYDPPAPHDVWYREVSTGADAGAGRVKRDPALDPDGQRAPTRRGRAARYDGEIRNDDLHFERFVADLDARGMLDDTLLVFTSDHGEYLGERGLWEHRPPGLRPVAHVPLLVFHPDGLGAGRRIAAPAQLVDVVPTVLDVLGIDPAAFPFQGDSLVPLLRGEAAGDRVVVAEEVTGKGSKDRPCFCGSLYSPQGFHWIRSSRLRAPLYRGERAWRLYAPGPEVDDRDRVLAGDAALWTHRRLTRALRRLQQTDMAIWRRITGGVHEVVRYDPDVQERLKALGYIE